MGTIVLKDLLNEQRSHSKDIVKNNWCHLFKKKKEKILIINGSIYMVSEREFMSDIDKQVVTPSVLLNIAQIKFLCV